MKTVIAATLVLFSISTASYAFEIPNIDGMEGIQQMMQQGKGGKRSQRQAQQQQGDESQGQQSRRGGGMQGMMKDLMNGDTSALQGTMSSFGQ